MKQAKVLTQKEMESLYGSGVVNSVKAVFKSGDIDKLTKNAYNFITVYMSFIAHYSLEGFKDVYQNIDKFALKLQTTEGSRDTNKANQLATHYQTQWFVEKHGADRQRMIANTIRELSRMAKEYDTPLFM